MAWFSVRRIRTGAALSRIRRGLRFAASQGRAVKFVLSTTAIALFVFLVWTGYFVFQQKETPVWGDSSVAGAIGLLGTVVALVVTGGVLRSRRYKGTRPSFKLVLFSAVAVYLVCAYAGVEPFSTYQETVHERVGDWASSLRGESQDDDPDPTLTPPVSPTATPALTATPRPTPSPTSSPKPTLTPKVATVLDMAVSPKVPTTADIVTVVARAKDSSGIERIELYFNNIKRRECQGAALRKEDGYSTCSYTTGPLSEGVYDYWAVGYDTNGARWTSGRKQLVLAPPTPTPPPSWPRYLQLGESTDADGRLVTVISATSTDSYGGTYPTEAERGYEFIIVDAEVQNVGMRTPYTSHTDFSLSDSTDLHYDAMPNSSAGAFPSVQLFPGERNAGAILFLVPKAAVGLKAVYDFDPLDVPQLAIWRLSM